MLHRLAFFFEDEVISDREVWAAWLANAPPGVKELAEMGERRPVLKIAAPFPSRENLPTRREDEERSLEVLEELIGALKALAASGGRTTKFLMSGKPVGSVTAAGPDTAVTEMLAEWRQLFADRAPDVEVWERKGWVSVWAGNLEKAEHDKLLKRYHATEGPISSFARAIGIEVYEPQLIEASHRDTPRKVEVAIGAMSHAASYLEQIPVDARTQEVTSVVALYDADFSKRPRDAARKRLKYLGSFPYKKTS